MRRLEESLKTLAREAQLAAIARAEALALELDPALKYPEDWVGFRLLGHNSLGSRADVLSGAELRADLGPLVERVCAGVGLKSDEVGEALDARAVLERWKMSRATLNRLRRRGLIGRRVIYPDLRPRLVFTREIIEQFESARSEELAKVGEFSRVDPAHAARIARRAARYRRCLGWSVNQAAARIAVQTGRSHEGVRQVLRRAAAGGDTRLSEAPALGHERRELLYRAWRRGVDVSLMSRKVHRSRGAVRRAIAIARAERLRELLTSGALGERAQKSGDNGVLSALPVRTGLGAVMPLDLLGFLRAARNQGPPIGAEERARLVAYHQLRGDAARLIAGLDRLQPSPARVDLAETSLRWAARLKAELVRSQLRLLLETLTARLGRPVEEFPAPALITMITGGLKVVGDAVDAHDVARGGRLAGPAGLHLDRYAAGVVRSMPQVSSGRRAAVLVPGGLMMPEWEREVAPWQSIVEPDARLRPGIARGLIMGEPALILSKRFGWDGGPPRTLAQLAAELLVSRIRVAQVEQRALAAGLRAIRAA